MKVIKIDGSAGEGGGQIVRSSLALAAVTGTAVEIDQIRGGRTKPGLLRQHLAGVKAIQAITRADVVGAELRSSSLRLVPHTLEGGEYAFEVGSAGSAVLVAQTVLPALLFANRESIVTIQGGTHAQWAPPFDFFANCFLPLLARMNASVNASIESHGFYPAGGGKIELRIKPTEGLKGLSLVERKGELRTEVRSLVADIPMSVGERECDIIRRKTGWHPDCFETRPIEKSGGPGNVVMIQCGFDNVTEMATGFGRVGVRAERVARSALREAKAYLASGVPVGNYLADQLLLPSGIAVLSNERSEFRTTKLSLHCQTHIEVLRRFLDLDIQVRENEDDSVSVKLS
ncbi:RNA 3'-terminal phosphate cyclase [Rhodopirellula sallentina]|uniref:RNA 3'-terminal phosphate cyclase n=1 Tax=Rhodopirellula sallentina SM41 TaxID=1263870 RepID=M5UAQ9_9BACT|nr:RNA 3'-terminal phosphate cyclase [Rhodopirellula sallentina]EMI58510.1 RNA 3'-terminal-phosphate cyclase [Rhodopirellula sallentina SM41]